MATDTVIASGAYRYNTTTTPPPASGECRINGIDVNATLVYIHYTTDDGRDTKAALKTIVVNSVLRIEKDAANLLHYTVTGAPTDRGTYAEIPVSFKQSAGVLGQNAAVVVYIETSALATDLTTLRDQFAVSIIGGLVSSRTDGKRMLALAAYDLAEEMLAVRAERPTPVAPLASLG